MNFNYYKSDKLILFIIAQTVLFGVLSTWIHHMLFSTAEPIKTIVLFTDSFTVPFFIFITMHMVNSRWWKSRYFKWLIDVPDLNGRYVGKLNSSFPDENGNPKIMDCALEITQTASSIHISGYFGNIETGEMSSDSISVSEQIVKGRNGFFSIYYVFTNETGGLPEKLNNHQGTATFIYYPDIYKLRGAYYNKLKNMGTIEVSFEQSTLLARLKF